MAWLEQQEVMLLVMDRAGKITFSTNMAISNVKVRKAQYAATAHKKLDISIRLIQKKTQAQIDTLLKIQASEAIMLLELGMREIARAKSIPQLMQREGKLAAIYSFLHHLREN